MYLIRIYYLNSQCIYSEKCPTPTLKTSALEQSQRQPVHQEELGISRVAREVPPFATLISSAQLTMHKVGPRPVRPQTLVQNLRKHQKTQHFNAILFFKIKLNSKN